MYSELIEGDRQFQGQFRYIQESIKVTSLQRCPFKVKYGYGITYLIIRTLESLSQHLSDDFNAVA